MMLLRAVQVVVIAGLAAGASYAHANCARGVGYGATIDDKNTVTIQPYNFDMRGCPAEALLRQDVNGGAVVQVAGVCGPASSDDAAPFLDECVPKGRYRYGFATPYQCHASSCGTSYFTEIEVAGEPAASCVRTGDAPSETTAAVPWKSSALICNYRGAGCSASAGGAVLGLNGAVLLFGLALMWHRRRSVK